MNRISLRVTERLISGNKRSFQVGSDESMAIVINLLSRQGIVGCLTLQFDDSGKPFIRLEYEQGFTLQVNSFRQTKLLCFIEQGDKYRRGGKKYVD